MYPQIKSCLIITYTIRYLRVVTSSRKYTPYHTIIISCDLLCNGMEIVTIAYDQTDTTICCTIVYTMGPWCIIFVNKLCFHWMYVFCKQAAFSLDGFYRLLDRLVVECWLRVGEVPGSIPSQGPRHSKDVIKMVPVVPLFGTQH